MTAPAKWTALVCGRVDATPADGVMLASVQQPCAECGAACWVSLSGQALLRVPGHRVICLRCSLDQVLAHPGMPLEPVPGAREEALAHLMRGRGGVA